MSDNPSHLLRPSFIKAFGSVMLLIFVLCSVSVVQERLQRGHWQGRTDIELLLLPIFLVPTILCLAFVPRGLRWSVNALQIQSFSGRWREYPWAHLYAYGSGNQVFLLQFEGTRTLQIFGWAFRRAEWKRYRQFLDTAYPEKKARFWFGSKAFR